MFPTLAMFDTMESVLGLWGDESRAAAFVVRETGVTLPDLPIELLSRASEAQRVAGGVGGHDASRSGVPGGRFVGDPDSLFADSSSGSTGHATAFHLEDGRVEDGAGADYGDVYGDGATFQLPRSADTLVGSGSGNGSGSGIGAAGVDGGVDGGSVEDFDFDFDEVCVCVGRWLLRTHATFHA